MQYSIKPKLRKPYHWTDDWLCYLLEVNHGYLTRAWGDSPEEAYENFCLIFERDYGCSLEEYNQKQNTK